MMLLLQQPIEEFPYCWLIQSGQGKLGVNKNNGWCVGIGDQIIFFNSEEKCVPLVPLLDIEEKKFFDFLNRTMLVKPDYADAIKRFPKVLLLKHVFNSSFSGYWPERALEWIVADKHIQSSLKDELTRFAQNKAMPQRARQKAERIVRRL